MFYYCFNNNKRARGSQALVRSWRPMGVLGRGRGEASGGQRWRVKKEKVGELGLAQDSCVPVHFPPSSHPLPTSLPLHGFSPPCPKSYGTGPFSSVSVSSLPALSHEPCHLPPSSSHIPMASQQLAFKASHDHPLSSPLTHVAASHVPLPAALLSTAPHTHTDTKWW